MPNFADVTAARPARLGGIEAARGIAAVMVVFYHAARHMKLNIGYLPFGGFSKFWPCRGRFLLRVVWVYYFLCACKRPGETG